MNDINYYSNYKSVNDWVTTIEDKFPYLSLERMVKDICDILTVTDKKEIKKLEKASLKIHGKRIGVLTFKDACLKLNIKPIASNILALLPKHTSAEYKLSIIIKAINPIDYVPDWSNSNEYKWYPWFNMHRFSFGYAHGDWDTASSIVGSHLCLFKKEDAEYMGKWFTKLYKDLMVR